MKKTYPTAVSVLEAIDEYGYLEGVIAVPLSDMINDDSGEGFREGNNYAMNALFETNFDEGEEVLIDVTYSVVGCDTYENLVYIEVSGKADQLKIELEDKLAG